MGVNPVEQTPKIAEAITILGLLCNPEANFIVIDKHKIRWTREELLKKSVIDIINMTGFKYKII